MCERAGDKKIAGALLAPCLALVQCEILSGRSKGEKCDRKEHRNAGGDVILGRLGGLLCYDRGLHEKSRKMRVQGGYEVACRARVI